MLNERSQVKRQYIWFYLYEMFRTGKSTETESRLWWPEAGGNEERRVTAIGCGVFLCSNENVLELESSDGFTSLEYTKNYRMD